MCVALKGARCTTGEHSSPPTLASGPSAKAKRLSPLLATRESSVQKGPAGPFCAASIITQARGFAQRAPHHPASLNSILQCLCFGGKGALGVQVESIVQMHRANRFGNLTGGQGSAQGRSCSPVRAVLVGLILVPGSAPVRAVKCPRASSAAGSWSVLKSGMTVRGC